MFQLWCVQYLLFQKKDSILLRKGKSKLENVQKRLQTWTHRISLQIQKPGFLKEYDSIPLYIRIMNTRDREEQFYDTYFQQYASNINAVHRKCCPYQEWEEMRDIYPLISIQNKILSSCVGKHGRDIFFVGEFWAMRYTLTWASVL